MKSKLIPINVKTVMRKTAFICLLVVFFLGSAYSQNWESGSLEEALTKSKNSGKLLLLDFFQEYG